MLDHIRKMKFWLFQENFPVKYKCSVLLVRLSINTVLKRFKCYKTKFWSAITVPLLHEMVIFSVLESACTTDGSVGWIIEFPCSV